MKRFVIGKVAEEGVVDKNRAVTGLSSLSAAEQATKPMAPNPGPDKAAEKKPRKPAKKASEEASPAQVSEAAPSAPAKKRKSNRSVQVPFRLENRIQLEDFKDFYKRKWREEALKDEDGEPDRFTLQSILVDAVNEKLERDGADFRVNGPPHNYYTKDRDNEE